MTSGHESAVGAAQFIAFMPLISFIVFGTDAGIVSIPSDGSPGDTPLSVTAAPAVSTYHRTSDVANSPFSVVLTVVSRRAQDQREWLEEPKSSFLNVDRKWRFEPKLRL